MSNLSQDRFTVTLLETPAVVSMHGALHSLALAHLEHQSTLAMLEQHAYKGHLSIIC